MKSFLTGLRLLEAPLSITMGREYGDVGLETKMWDRQTAFGSSPAYKKDLNWRSSLFMDVDMVFDVWLRIEKSVFSRCSFKKSIDKQKLCMTLAKCVVTLTDGFDDSDDCPFWLLERFVSRFHVQYENGSFWGK